MSSDESIAARRRARRSTSEFGHDRSPNHPGLDAPSASGGTVPGEPLAARQQRHPKELSTMTTTTPTAQRYAEESPAAPAARLVPTIIPIETPTLGDRSYLVHDGEVALVVDPQRDIDRVLDLAAREGVTITQVFETHIHNDYVTGGLALAGQTGAGVFRQWCRRGFLRSNSDQRRRRDHGRHRAARPCPRHPRAHLHPPVLRADGRW
jgi:glyoxylase-like metal-dependent hydrolase (beta-lactamase superfamily II)